MTKSRLGLGVAFLLLATYGCSSTMYVPRPDGRIAMTSASGAIQFTKNGTSVPASMDNLQQVVAEDPVAAEVARQSASDLRTGLVLDLGGLALTLAGGFVIAPATNSDGTMRSVSDGRAFAGGAMMLGGLVSICVAISYLSSGQAHQLDAINMYNDRVAAWPPPSAAGPPPPLLSPVPFAPPPPSSAPPAAAPTAPAPPADPATAPPLPAP